MAQIDPSKSGLAGHGYQDSDSKFTAEEVTILSISEPRDIESADGVSHSKVNARIKGLGTFWMFSDSVKNTPDWIPEEGIPAKVLYKLVSYEDKDGNQVTDKPSLTHLEFQIGARGLNQAQLEDLAKHKIAMFS